MSSEKETIELEVAGADAGQRLDRFLPVALGREGRDESRAILQHWIKEGAVRVNERAVKPRHSIEKGDRIIIEIPAPETTVLEAEAMDLAVLFEDEDIIVIDKAPGIVIHPGSGNEGGTLVNALLHHCQGQLCELAGEDRPGIVHRLDKDTSGCLVAAKSEQAYRSLVDQFSNRLTGKEYLAVTGGIPAPESGEIRNRIGRHPVHRQRMAVVDEPAGKEASTDYRVLQSSEEEGWALLSCVIHTGRTHQIRVHLREVLGCAILGDVIYAPRKPVSVSVDRLMLHAWKLSFSHPVSEERMNFESEIPEAFLRFCE
jgi:23S rRNA pseudouridine1911/1915/1917 synthase